MFAISLQFPRPDDSRNEGPADYVHFCGGTLIDNGKRVLTAASCIWNNEFEFTNPSDNVADFRNSESNSSHTGTFKNNVLIFAALAPRCRHFQGVVSRSKVTNYYIHPQYNGNPGAGYDIAIVDLKKPFDGRWSDNSFKEYIEEFQSSDLDKLEFPSNVTDLKFFGWGAQHPEEAQEDDRIFWMNISPAKEVSLVPMDTNVCINALILSNPELDIPRSTALCATQDERNNITNICTFDVGSPLVGQFKDSSEPQVLGVLTMNQDRICTDKAGDLEVFTDIRKVSEFLMNVLEPKELPKEEVLTSVLERKEKGKKEDNDHLPIITAVISVVLVVILISVILVAFVWYRKRQQDRKRDEQCKWLLSSQDTYFQLNKDVSDIHSTLGSIALKQKDPRTGRARRHSDIPAQLNFLQSKEKVETQILGYMGPLDDSLMNTTRGAVPISPFILAAMQNSKNSINSNGMQPVQRTLPMNGLYPNIQDRLVQLSRAMDMDSLVGRSSGDIRDAMLITATTPARDDFDLNVDFDTELELKERLGTGAFGSVYRAIWAAKKLEVAVKIVHAHILEQLMDDISQGGSSFNSFIGEISLLSRMDNPHIVKSYGACLKPPNVCLLLEYVNNGSLDSFIQYYPGEIPIPVVLRMALGIAEGLAALHPTVVHRDLKPQNVLLDDSYNVKLADFGMSRMKENTFLSDSMVKGTPSYIAPEVFKGENVDEKCDVYALGLIIWEMVSKERPWQDLNLPVVIMARVAVKHERPIIPETCPPELSRLIARCWDPNPRERPSAHEVAQKLILLRRSSRGAKSQKSDDTAFQETLATLQSKTPSKMQDEKDAQYQSTTSDYNFSQYSIQSSYPEIQMSQIQEA
eukprot:TRINITY_DN10319_c0_g1_i7.p1 TRINITY_DN10319_c0_g1~~TRINITY_DN10319_c0_g1_i7.p1  ORF type:complete len:861 (-),score=134.17 TRINITY_DN10319_c0_g1_i7:1166-3748(-)